MTAPAAQRPVPPALAGGALVFGVFFGAIGIAILRMPFEPGTPSWVVWTLRAFVILIFGTMAALGLYGFVVTARGPREPPLPEPLLTRCAACGQRILPTTEACTGCGRAPGLVGQAWREDAREGGGGLFTLGLGGGLVSLGVLMVGSVLSGGAGLVRGIAYVALGLLLLLVGGVMVYGSLVLLRDAARDRGRRTFTLSLSLDGAEITASAKITPRSTDLRGLTVTRRPPGESPELAGLDAPTPPSLRAVVRALSALHSRGEASLSLDETLQWNAGEDDEPTRLVQLDVELSTVSPQLDDPADARDHILYALDEGITLRDLVASLPDDSQLRNAFETYAEGLEPGDVDPRTSCILAAALAGGGGPAPYRQQG